MKKLIIISIFFCGFTATHSQDTLLLNKYEQKIIENSKLINDLQIEKQKLIELRDSYKKDTLTLRKQVKDLVTENTSLKQKISDLNKNKLKEDRDALQSKVDSLKLVVSRNNQIISEKEIQIISEKENTNKSVEKAKNATNELLLGNIIDYYKNTQFDELIKSNNKESLSRDRQFVSNNVEVKQIMDDLMAYYNAEELLMSIFNANKTNNVQIQLNSIKRQSNLLKEIKEKIEYYNDYNEALKDIIYKIDNLDKNKSAMDDAEIQKRKFNEIVVILSDYMYNYYEYNKYPYLTNIVNEVISVKKVNADASVKDLLMKL